MGHARYLHGLIQVLRQSTDVTGDHPRQEARSIPRQPLGCRDEGPPPVTRSGTDVKRVIVDERSGGCRKNRSSWLPWLGFLKGARGPQLLSRPHLRPLVPACHQQVRRPRTHSPGSNDFPENYRNHPTAAATVPRERRQFRASCDRNCHCNAVACSRCHRTILPGRSGYRTMCGHHGAHKECEGHGVPDAPAE